MKSAPYLSQPPVLRAALCLEVSRSGAAPRRGAPVRSAPPAGGHGAAVGAAGGGDKPEGEKTFTPNRHQEDFQGNNRAFDVVFFHSRYKWHLLFDFWVSVNKQ